MPRSLRSVQSEESIVDSLDEEVSLEIRFRRLLRTEIDGPAFREGREDVAVGFVDEKDRVVVDVNSCVGRSTYDMGDSQASDICIMRQPAQHC